MKTIIPIAAAFALFLSQAPETNASGSKTNSCCSTTHLPAAKSSDRSLYQLESIWTNHAGAAVRLGSLRGRPQVVSMFFASCSFTCPILVNDMKRIEASLPAHARTNVGFVLISFDSARDNPASLAKYRSTHQLGANWTLLCGDSDDVQELALLLGFKFKRDSRGDFAHSNVITLLDSNGEILKEQVGLTRDPVPMMSAVQRALGTCCPRKPAE